MALRNLLDREHVLLAGIVVLGLFFRLNGLGSVSLWFDEAVTANAVLSFLENGVPALPSGYEYWRAFPQTVLSAVSVYVLGNSEFALRLPSALAGTATVYVTYLAGKEFFDRETGLIAAGLLAVSTWSIVMSQQVRMYALHQLLYLSAVLLVYRTGENASRRNVLGLLAVSFTAMLIHVTAYILPFVAAAYIYALKELELDTRVFLLGIVSAAVVFSRVFYHSYLDLLNQLVFSVNIFRYLSWAVEAVPVIGLAGLAGYAIAARKPGAALLTGLAVFPGLYIYFFHVPGIAPRYIYFVLPFLAIWAGFAVIESSRKLEERFPGADVYHVAGLLAVLVVLLSAGMNYGNEGLYRPVEDHRSAYQYIENHGKGVLVTQWTAPAVYYFRPPDYALYGDRFDSSDYTFNGVETYSGAEFIHGDAELQAVIEENPRGWLVLQDTAYSVKPAEMKETISSLSLAAEYPGVKVWRWNRSR